MKMRTALLALVGFCVISAPAFADYGVSDQGMWPQSWPRELEPLRNRARTFEGPEVLNRHYLIPFTEREEFEAAWPHLLKVKSKGAPIILVRGPKRDFFAVKPAGVVIHTPPVVDGEQQRSGAAIPGRDNPRATWTKTAYMELAIDGKIVDLNRIPLPADTPIIDERFTDENETAYSSASPARR